MNDHQIAQERMSYLSEIRDHIIDYIYEAKEKLIKEEMWVIANENAALLNTDTVFIFNGKWFPIIPPKVMLKHVNRKLHPSLLKRMTDLIHEKDYDYIEEKHTLVNYIGSILQFAGHFEDLKNIFPYPIHEALGAVRPNKFSTEYFPKPTEEIKSFKDANSIGSDCLNQLLVIRMVQKDI